MVFRKSRWVNISCVHAVVSGPKFTEHFSSNAEGIAVDNLVTDFECLSVPEIFTLKV